MTEEYFRKLVIRLLVAILLRLIIMDIHPRTADEEHTSLYYEARSHVEE